MRNRRNDLRKNRSGQLLIFAALAIAVLISSIAIYVQEVSVETNVMSSHQSADALFTARQNTRNAVVSALANFSEGGEKSILAGNLNSLSEILRKLYQFGMYTLHFAPLNDSIYESGIRIANETEVGVSSAYVDILLETFGSASSMNLEYTINITTSTFVNGSYVDLEGDEKLVNLTCSLFNEDKPALANEINLFYEDSAVWVPINSSYNLSTLDYGNGTYLLSFKVATSSDVRVSVHIRDSRGVRVQASLTCYES